MPLLRGTCQPTRGSPLDLLADSPSKDQDTLSRPSKDGILCLLGGKLMRSSRIHLILSVLVFSLLLASPAFAHTISMTYTGHHGATAQNGSPYIGYPYYISLNGSTTSTAMMCDSFDNTVIPSETWNATASPFLQGIATSMFGPSMTLDYKAAGLMFESVLNGTLNSNTAQWAIWGFFSTFSSDPQALAYFLANPNFAATEATYLALAGLAPNSAYNGLTLYTPLDGAAGHGPQEFIGYSAVPEPSSVMFMGTGLVGLAGVIRRKLAKV
jgi:hypothetical protein